MRSQWLIYWIMTWGISLNILYKHRNPDLNSSSNSKERVQSLHYTSKYEFYFVSLLCTNLIYSLIKLTDGISAISLGKLFQGVVILRYLW